MKSNKNHKLFVFIFALFFANTNLWAQATDTTLAYPFSNGENGGMFMHTPSNISSVVNYDFINNQYFIQNKIGGLDAGKARTLSFKEYQQYKLNKSIAEYWDLKSGERKGNQSSAFGLPKLFIPGQAFDRIFGGNAVDIRPQGSAELIFGIKTNRLDNPQLPEEQRKTTSFDFQEKIYGGSVPKEYIPSVQKGVIKAMDGGVIAGYPVVDVKATLVDGSFHPVDSSGICFEIAGSHAFAKGLKEAKPVLLEPVIPFILKMVCVLLSIVM